MRWTSVSPPLSRTRIGSPTSPGLRQARRCSGEGVGVTTAEVSSLPQDAVAAAKLLRESRI